MGFFRKHKQAIIFIPLPFVVTVLVIALIVVLIKYQPDQSLEQRLDIGDGYVAEIYKATYMELTRPVYCRITKDGREIHQMSFITSDGSEDDGVFRALENDDGRYVAIVEINTPNIVRMVYDKVENVYLFNSLAEGILSTFSTSTKLYVDPLS